MKKVLVRKKRILRKPRNKICIQCIKKCKISAISVLFQCRGYIDEKGNKEYPHVIKKEIPAKIVKNEEIKLKKKQKKSIIKRSKT